MSSLFHLIAKQASNKDTTNRCCFNANTCLMNTASIACFLIRCISWHISTHFDEIDYVVKTKVKNNIKPRFIIDNEYFVSFYY